MSKHVRSVLSANDGVVNDEDVVAIVTGIGLVLLGVLRLEAFWVVNCHAIKFELIGCFEVVVFILVHHFFFVPFIGVDLWFSVGTV